MSWSMVFIVAYLNSRFMAPRSIKQDNHLVAATMIILGTICIHPQPGHAALTDHWLLDYPGIQVYTHIQTILENGHQSAGL